MKNKNLRRFSNDENAHIRGYLYIREDFVI